MQILKADTLVNVKVGPFVDATDGVTPETAITLAAADQAEMLKDGSTSVTDISGNAFGTITNCGGWYWLTLTAAQLDTEGLLSIVIQDSSVCLPVFAHFMVVSANVFDSLYAAATTDYLQVDTIQITGTAQTANDVGADVNDILVDTAVIGALGAGLTAIPWNAAWDAEVQSEATDALNAYDPPTKTEMDAAHALLATPAQVNTEVLDVLATDTHAEPAAVIAATSSLKDKICWLFTLARNKITQTSATTTLRNDADAADIATSTVSDDATTATRGEWT